MDCPAMKIVLMSGSPGSSTLQSEWLRDHPQAGWAARNSYFLEWRIKNSTIARVALGPLGSVNDPLALPPDQA